MKSVTFLAQVLSIPTHRHLTLPYTQDQEMTIMKEEKEMENNVTQPPLQHCQPLLPLFTLTGTAQIIFKVSFYSPVKSIHKSHSNGVQISWVSHYSTVLRVCTQINWTCKSCCDICNGRRKKLHLSSRPLRDISQQIIHKTELPSTLQAYRKSNKWKL